jgi:type I restriction enzyme R subunit
VAIKFDELKREFKKVISSLSGIFDGVKRDDGRESLFSALSVLEDDKQLKQFKSKLSEVKKLYETIAPDSFLQDFIGEYGWLIEVNEAYNKVQNRQKTDLSEYQEKTKALIKEKLLIDRIEVALPTFEIDKHYLKAIDSEGYSTDQKIMDMKRALEHHIRINLETNPIYETLSQRLARILRAKNKSEILAELKTLVDEIAEIEEQTKRMGVTKEEFALFNVTKKYDSELPDQEMITFVKKLVKEVKTKTFQGWQRNRKVVKDVEGSVFDSCYQTFSSRMETAKVSSLTDEVMKFVMKYNA